MKRQKIIQRLLKEGFSEKTLLNFSDKQLNSLSVRILGESNTSDVTDVSISKDDPEFDRKMEDAKKDEKSIETYESEDKGKKPSKCVPGKKKKKKSEGGVVSKWVKSLAEQKYHTFTSKNEIMEMIKSKLTKEEVGTKVKKGHNNIPEFMTYSSIKSNSGTEIAPAKPTTVPTKNPTPARKTPYNPGPGKNPKPKALKEKEEVPATKQKTFKVKSDGIENK